jgi:peptidoglycan/LPS O-acetylase OafA/YrhL
MRYRADIDGLRSLAVIPVVLFHAGIPFMSGGFVGVDVFFVISGFLITGIILREAEAGTYSLMGFYERRVRRIFPALFAMLLVTSAACFAILPPEDLRAYGEGLAAAILFVSNMYLRLDSGYFAAVAETRPLLHTWSLAVEEQYYIFFPPILAFLIARAQRFAVPALWVATLLSFAACVVLTEIKPAAAFYVAPTRAWELLVGALLAAWRPRALPMMATQGLGLIGLGLILAAIFGFDETTSFPGGAAAVPVLGAAAIILAGGAGGGWVTRLLATAPLRGVGLISYSLYLWHWPILVLLAFWTVRAPSPLESAGAVALSVLLAFLSWRYVERPFRRPNLVRTRRGALSLGVGVMALGLAGAAALVVADGAPWRYSPEAWQMLAGVQDRAPLNDCRDAGGGAGRPFRVCALGVLDTPVDFLLWGDSHGLFASPAFDLAGKTVGRAGDLVGRPGCPPLLGLSRIRAAYADCAMTGVDVLAHLDANPQIRTVILFGRWAAYADGGPFLGGPSRKVFLRDDVSTERSLAENRATFARAATRTIAALRGRGIKTLVVEATPETEYQIPVALAQSIRLNRDVDLRPLRIDYERRQAGVNAIFGPIIDAAGTGAAWLWIKDAFCGPEHCRVLTADGRPAYLDSNHLSDAAARELAPRVAAALRPGG